MSVIQTPVCGVISGNDGTQTIVPEEVRDLDRSGTVCGLQSSEEHMAAAYGQYCPIAKASEILGQRWTLLVLRELLIGSRRFNDIARGVPMMSRTMLSKRLRTLTDEGLLDKIDGEYHLTPSGQALRPVVFGLGEWCTEWLLEDPLREECDPEVLMWWVHARLDTSALPDRRVVLEFSFTDGPKDVWVVVEKEGPSVCLNPPGFEIDAVIAADTATFYKVWYGRENLRAVIRDGQMRLHGSPAIVRRLPIVLSLRPPEVLGARPDAPVPTSYRPA